MSDWIGARLGFPVGVGKEVLAERPWWTYNGYATWTRSDGVWITPSLFQGKVDGWTVYPSPHVDDGAETGRYAQITGIPAAEVDRDLPLARPPVRAGQVWADTSDTHGEPALFLVTGSGPSSFDWIDGEVVRRTDDERIDLLLAGWVLVAGPGAPWAPWTP